MVDVLLPPPPSAPATPTSPPQLTSHAITTARLGTVTTTVSAGANIMRNREKQSLKSEKTELLYIMAIVIFLISAVYSFFILNRTLTEAIQESFLSSIMVFVSFAIIKYAKYI